MTPYQVSCKCEEAIPLMTCAKMANVTTAARIKHKSLVITLLDLKMCLVKYSTTLF